VEVGVESAIVVVQVEQKEEREQQTLQTDYNTEKGVSSSRKPRWDRGHPHWPKAKLRLEVLPCHLLPRR
jgi:hypothetical protein